MLSVMMIRTLVGACLFLFVSMVEGTEDRIVGYVNVTPWRNPFIDFSHGARETGSSCQVNSGVCSIIGNCSFSRNLEGNWSIEKDGRELGRMTVAYTRMDVTFMGQTYNYTCKEFDYTQEKYLLRSTNGNGMACFMFSNGGNTLMMIRLHMTHLYHDKSFFTPQQVADSSTMDSICNNFDDGQMLFIHYLP